MNPKRDWEIRWQRIKGLYGIVSGDKKKKKETLKYSPIIQS